MITFCELKDLCTDIIDCPHSTPKWLNEGIPVIRNYNISGGQLDLSKLSYVDEETYENRIRRAKPIENDIIISREAPMGEVCLVPPDFKCCLGQRLVLLKVDKEKCNPHYLLYALLSPYVQAQIKRIDQTGSIVSNLNIPDLKKLIIPIIAKNQDDVAECLKVLNEKISNNNKIAVELESMAKTIYDYWFLQFEFPNKDGKPYKSSGGKMVWNEELKREIPEGWRNGTLEDLGEIIAGGTPSTNHPEYYSENGIAWITPNDLSNSNDKYITHGERDISEIGLNNSSARLMPKGTVLLTSRAPIGYLGIAANEVCTNQGFKSIVPNEKFGSEFIYHTVENMIVYLKSLGTGSTFTEISKTVVASVKIAIPEESVVGKFEEMVSEICAKHRIIERENKELISLRDYLLPLLMNGQVGFKD